MAIYSVKRPSWRTFYLRFVTERSFFFMRPSYCFPTVVQKKAVKRKLAAWEAAQEEDNKTVRSQFGRRDRVQNNWNGCP
jgi:hypothetical protein